MMIIGQQISIWKEQALLFEDTSKGQLKGICKTAKTYVLVPGSETEIRTEYLPNVRLQRHFYIYLIGIL
jgi:hypothetical protein